MATKKRLGFKKSIEAVWKPLLVLFLVGVIVVSWNNISWLFNSAYAWRYLTGVFSSTGGRQPATVMTIKPSQTTNVKPVVVNNVMPIDPTPPAADDPPVVVKSVPDSITIPAIQISAPIVTTEVTDVDAVHALLDTGVVLYPGSAPFGQMGETIILGHSAPPGWPKIKYDWAFSKIGDLKAGDKINITYSNKNYSYTVAKIKVLDRGQEVPSNIATANTLALISCWPPGKDLNRIAVLAVINN
jgi:LPXTG-site transpeptidase (sortase) family protein